MLAADYAFGAAVAVVIACNLYFRRRIKSARVAMQWGFDGSPTWSAPKSLALWGTPVFMFAIRLLVWLAMTYAPQSVHGVEIGIVLFSVIAAAAHAFILRMAESAN
jgi:hypothetical protein